MEIIAQTDEWRVRPLDHLQWVHQIKLWVLPKHPPANGSRRPDTKF
jgi:hypothetical protein